MDASTIDAMDLVVFEQMLADEWAVTRSDIYRQGYGPTPLINAVQPIRVARLSCRGADRDCIARMMPQIEEMSG